MQVTIREPGSAITHFIAWLMAIVAASPLIMKAESSSHIAAAAMIIFMASMILLYGASTAYHSVYVSDKILKIFRKIDRLIGFKQEDRIRRDLNLLFHFQVMHLIRDIAAIAQFPQMQLRPGRIILIILCTIRHNQRRIRQT